MDSRAPASKLVVLHHELPVGDLHVHASANRAADTRKGAGDELPLLVDLRDEHFATVAEEGRRSIVVADPVDLVRTFLPKEFGYAENEASIAIFKAELQLPLYQVVGGILERIAFESDPVDFAFEKGEDGVVFFAG